MDGKIVSILLIRNQLTPALNFFHLFGLIFFLHSGPFGNVGGISLKESIILKRVAGEHCVFAHVHTYGASLSSALTIAVHIFVWRIKRYWRLQPSWRPLSASWPLSPSYFTPFPVRAAGTRTCSSSATQISTTWQRSTRPCW